MMINTKCLYKSIPKLSNPTTKHTKDYHSFTIMQILIYPNGTKSVYKNKVSKQKRRLSHKAGQTLTILYDLKTTLLSLLCAAYDFTFTLMSNKICTHLWDHAALDLNWPWFVPQLTMLMKKKNYNKIVCQSERYASVRGTHGCSRGMQLMWLPEMIINSTSKTPEHIDKKIGTFVILWRQSNSLWKQLIT
jgi:hypothetical protein